METLEPLKPIKKDPKEWPFRGSTKNVESPRDFESREF